MLRQHCFAQSSPPPTRKAPPPPPAPPAVDQEQFISYWTTETGWRTELQLRNNQVGQVLTVTPVLGTPDGSEIALFPVVIQPRDVKTVDLESAIGSDSPQLIGAYGSLTLRYRAPSQINLYAAAMITGVGHSIACSSTRCRGARILRPRRIWCWETSLGLCQAVPARTQASLE